MAGDFDAAALDTTVKVVSTVTVVIVVGAVGLMFAVVPSVFAWLFTVAMAIVMGLAWAMAPAGYAISRGDLVVRRRAWREFRSPLRGPADMEDPRNMGLRTGGSGGAFGYYGRFRRGDVGSYRAYLTTRDPEKVVAVQTDAGVVTLSPADPSAFLTAMGSEAG